MNRDTHIDLKAEAYFLTELQENIQEYEDFIVSCEGAQKRGYSQEVLGLSEFKGMREDKIIDMLSLEVSRNGIYHLLPEYLFIPFTLGKAAFNTPDVVEEVKKNHQRERDAKKFFAPIDTEFFLWKVMLLKRHFGWPNTGDLELLKTITTSFSGQELELENESIPLWLSLLSQSHQAKDNRELLQQYLQMMLKRKVTISEVLLPFFNSETVDLGTTRLGVDSVLEGLPPSEFMDWQVDIELFESEIHQEVKEHKIEKLVRAILEYFVLACRRILIEFEIRPEDRSPVLAEGTLGINTYLLN